MQTIIIVLNPGKLENPDLDLRYLVPDRIEEVSGGAIEDDGYDYVDAEEGEPGPLMGIWMRTENAAEAWHIIEDSERRNSWRMTCISQRRSIFRKRKRRIWKIVLLFFRNRQRAETDGSCRPCARITKYLASFQTLFYTVLQI